MKISTAAVQHLIIIGIFTSIIIILNPYMFFLDGNQLWNKKMFYRE